MTDKSGKCCYCIRTEMQPKNSTIHNHLYSDSQLLATLKHTTGRTLTSGSVLLEL